MHLDLSSTFTMLPFRKVSCKCLLAYDIIAIGKNDKSAHYGTQKAPEIATLGLSFVYHLNILTFLAYWYYNISE